MTSPALLPLPVPAPTTPAAPAAPAAPLPSDALAGGLAFHRLLFARPRSGWWTPLVVGALDFAIYVALMVVVIVVVLAFALSDPSVLDRLTAFSENPVLDVSDPFLLALTLVTIALMLPCYWVASLVVNGPRVGLISSAAGRLRWRWLLLCSAVAAVLAGGLTGLSTLVPTGAAASMPPSENPMLLVTLLLVLLLVPLQSTAEEYIFRGYFMQSLGRWLRHPAWGILLPVPLFVMGHLYDLLGLLGVAVFAVGAGWLTWRTGGLEAAIALHVMNNLSAFLLSLAGGAEAGASSPGLMSLVWTVLLVGGYIGVVEWLLRRRAARGRALPRTLVLTPALPAAVS